MATAAIPLASTAFSVLGKVQEGKSARKQGESVNAQQRENARRKRQEGKRQAEEIERQTARMMSDTEAIQAGSGFSGSDGAAARQIARQGGVGKYNELAALYETDQQAIDMERQGAAAKAQGRAQQRGAYMGAAATALGGIASFNKDGGFSQFKNKNPGKILESTPSWSRAVPFTRSFAATPRGSSIMRRPI